nr:hypothetical protein [Candidatus Sigynarchaeum springense]
MRSSRLSYKFFAKWEEKNVALREIAKIDPLALYITSNFLAFRVQEIKKYRLHEPSNHRARCGSGHAPFQIPEFDSKDVNLHDRRIQDDMARKFTRRGKDNQHNGIV